MTKREQFMSVLRNDQPPKWMGYAYDACPQDLKFHCFGDPITVWDILWIQGERVVDHWGTTSRFLPEKGDPGIVPIVTVENQVIKDITKWREYLTIPQIPDDLDWAPYKAAIEEARAQGHVIMVPSFRGLFERAHCLMVFEETLENLLLEPEAMYDLFGALADQKLEIMKQVIDNLNPDIIHFHDDWGSKLQLFFSHETFRTLLKPHYQRIFDYIKSRGVLIQHHSDSYMMGLEQDMVDLGIDMWHGALPSNDLPAFRAASGGKILMMGGIDSGVIDHPKGEITEEQIRAEVRRAIDEYAPGGAFVPCITSIECINEWVTPIAIDECNRYGAEWLAKQK